MRMTKQEIKQRLGVTDEQIANMDYDELLQLKRDFVVEKCRDDVEYYVRNYCVYEDKDAPELIQPFNMWEAQKEALNSIDRNRLNIILKARQLGITWLVISYASWVLRMRPGRTVIGLSRTEDEAIELVRRLSVEFENMKTLIRDKKEQGWNWVTYERYSLRLIIHFPNEPDSVFYAFPSAPGAVRSFTADLVIFDEWAFQQWAEQIWISASPTINRPTGGKFIGLSTNIRGSLFESIYIDNSNGFNKIFIPWHADPRRNQEWYEATRAMIGNSVTQEYPATVEEALTVIGGARFDVSYQKHISDELMTGPVRRYVSIDYGFDMLSAHWYTLDTNYHAQCYREFDIPNYNAMQAADAIRDLTGDEKIELYLAPPDLWNRQSTTGKSTADVFYEHGIILTKVDNSMFNGCMRMDEWLYAKEGEKARFTIYKDSAPNLFDCLKKIQKDENNPNIYAKKPHNLTHDVDSFKYFAVYWTIPADILRDKNVKKWTDDMWEDYENANTEEKEMLISKWGVPK